MLTLPSAAAAPASQPADTFTFAVLGHLRGDPTDGITNYLLPELVEDVRRMRPDAVFLTGDMIWGDLHNRPADPDTVHREWDALDRALAEISVPIYRVPGNHDINDVVTRDIYFERYGRPPLVVDLGRCKFLLLCSTWVPEDGHTGPARGVRGWDLDPLQIDFITEQLADTDQYDHAFLFMGHMLWWDDDARWWQQVHPVLKERKVRAVFAGDYGPYKYSHMRKDGIDYLQCAIENPPSVEMMRSLESSRLLSQLMDVYLLVHVSGPDVRIEVRPVGAMSSGNYSPQRWRELYAYRSRLSTYLHKGMTRYPVRGLLAAAACGVAAGFLIGFFIKRRRRSA